MNTNQRDNVPFILGLIAIICMILGWFNVPGVGFIAIVLGIIAWVMGNSALKANPDDSRAKGGKIMGMVVTILAIISVVVVMILIGIIGGAAFVAMGM